VIVSAADYQFWDTMRCMTGDATSEALGSRLGYLLKHVHLRLAEASALALAPLGLDGRELAVLVVLAAEYPLSQLEAAGRLGIDRTTMVALVDALERKGLVERRRSPHDRRKNTVQLTATGQDRLHEAEHARKMMERQFLSPLSASDADQLVRALQVLVAAPPEPDL
jgi:DNA-binding MarR family transcriptional regulator